MKQIGTINEVPIYESPDCPPDQLLIINEEDLV